MNTATQDEVKVYDNETALMSSKQRTTILNKEQLITEWSAF